MILEFSELETFVLMDTLVRYIRGEKHNITTLAQASSLSDQYFENITKQLNEVIDLYNRLTLHLRTYPRLTEWLNKDYEIHEHMKNPRS